MAAGFGIFVALVAQQPVTTPPPPGDVCPPPGFNTQGALRGGKPARDRRPSKQDSGSPPPAGFNLTWCAAEGAAGDRRVRGLSPGAGTSRSVGGCRSRCPSFTCRRRSTTACGPRCAPPPARRLAAAGPPAAGSTRCWTSRLRWDMTWAAAAAAAAAPRRRHRAFAAARAEPRRERDGRPAGGLQAAVRQGGRRQGGEE